MIGNEAGAPPSRASRAPLATTALFALRTAVEAVGHNRLRASLTSLGILFGIASVIAMLAIGKGAEQEILAQLQLLGTNNIVITPVVSQREGAIASDAEAGREVKRFSPGLTLRDAEAIARVLPTLDAVSPEVVVSTTLAREGRQRSGRVVGVDPAYFRLLNYRVGEGRGFDAAHVERALPVAVIGHGVRTRFFTSEQPIGRPIKVGKDWFTVVGVLDDRQVVGENAERLGIRDASMDVYIPIGTMLARVRDRSRLTARQVQEASREAVVVGESGEEDEAVRAERTNPHQLDRLVLRVRDAAQVAPTADVVRRLLTRLHNDVVDVEVTVPELLLKQQQRTKTIFNLVLGAIASISLVVGGIGIMNIMLASVLERIREIGVRRAMGATQRDILTQFLAEAVLISAAGGVAGVLVGVGLSVGIERLAGIETLVSLLSIVVAVGVSLSVGVAFGIVPAWRAARQDPVTCLRYE